MTEDAEDARARRWRHFRNVRIAVLLSVLVLTAGTIELRLRRIRSWDRVLVVGIYPVAASTAPEVRPYIDSLREQDFTPIVTFLEREARRYGRSFSPPLVQIRLSKPVPEPPPVLADDPGALDVIRWSLALRLYSWRMHRDHGLPDADVELYTLFHAAGSPHALDTSLALSRLRMAVVNAEADPRTRPWLNVALTHELLHAASASDKYDPAGMPVHPDGYAEPNRAPLHPQTFCEIMAGQIPTGPGQFREPPGLDDCLIGARTAKEIGMSR